MCIRDSCCVEQIQEAHRQILDNPGALGQIDALMSHDPEMTLGDAIITARDSYYKQLFENLHVCMWPPLSSLSLPLPLPLRLAVVRTQLKLQEAGVVKARQCRPTSKRLSGLSRRTPGAPSSRRALSRWPTFPMHTWSADSARSPRSHPPSAGNPTRQRGVG